MQYITNSHVRANRSAAVCSAFVVRCVVLSSHKTEIREKGGLCSTELVDGYLGLFEEERKSTSNIGLGSPHVDCCQGRFFLYFFYLP